MLRQTRPLALVMLAGMIITLGCGLSAPRSDNKSAATPTGEVVTYETAGAATPTPTTTPTSTPTPTPEVTATPAPTPTPQIDLADKQVLVLSGLSPSTLDPHLSADANSTEYVVEIFSGLMAYDPELNLIPDIAAGYDVSPDGRVYTFNLRPEARFQNGKSIQAQDFKWSFERACAPTTNSPTAGTYLGDIVGCKDKLQSQAAEVAGVVALNDQTLQVTIDAPKGFFLAKMTYPTAYVLDQENVENGGPGWFMKPNGSGPFNIDEYSPGQRVITLRRNDNYYRDPRPTLTEVKFLIDAPIDLLAGYTQGLKALGAEEGVTYDVIPVPNEMLSQVADPTHPLSQQLVSVNLLSVDYIGFNVNQPPFDDVKIRQAFNLALDKRKIVKTVFYGTVPVANGIVPSSLPGYQNPDLSDYEFDLEHARDLIAASKYGRVSNLPPLTLVVGSSTANQAAVKAIAAAYQKNLGVEVTVKEVPWLEFLYNLKQPDMPYPMYRLGWLADYPDPQDFLEILFHSQSSQNYGQYNNTQVDALLDEARGTPDVKERLALYQQVEQLILNDAAWIPLYFEVKNWLVKPYVKGLRIPPINAPKFQYVMIEEH